MDLISIVLFTRGTILIFGNCIEISAIVSISFEKILGEEFFSWKGKVLTFWDKYSPLVWVSDQNENNLYK